MADLNPTQFASSVLSKIGVRPTRSNLKAMVGWMNAEGGHWNNSARYNPLNTTQSEPGAGNTGTQGNIKVYRNWQQGIDATAKTLQNGRYGGIINALKGGDTGAVADAIKASPWGTKNDLRGIMGAAKVGSTSLPTRSAVASRPGVPVPAGTAGPDQTAALVSALTSGSGKGSLLSRWQYALSQQPAPTAVDAPSVGSAPSAPSAGGSDLVSRAKSVASRLDAANNAGKLPYLWGGGHGAKLGAGDTTPVDCSGAVSQVLGVNPMVSGAFAKWGKPGEGSRITIYANGTHVFMKIDGKFWGTSRSNPGGGAGWIPSSGVNLAGFTVRHPDGA